MSLPRDTTVASSSAKTLYLSYSTFLYANHAAGNPNSDPCPDHTDTKDSKWCIEHKIILRSRPNLLKKKIDDRHQDTESVRTSAGSPAFARMPNCPNGSVETVSQEKNAIGVCMQHAC